MKTALRNDNFYGPYWLYVNNLNWQHINSVNTQTDRRFIEAIRADPEIAKVQRTHLLLSGCIVLVDAKPRAVQWVEGAMIRPVEWDEKGGLGTNYRVIGAGAPLIKSDYDAKSGVAYFTGAS